VASRHSLDLREPPFGAAGSCLLERVFHRAFGSGGPAPRLGLLECRVADAGAQPGQDRVVGRDPWHEGARPAAAAGVQDRAGGGEQADGSLRVVLLCGDGRQDFEVGGAGFVAGLGGQRQPFLQVPRRVGQVALGLPGQASSYSEASRGSSPGRGGPGPGRW
jgi:hypothetical protein